MKTGLDLFDQDSNEPHPDDVALLASRNLYPLPSSGYSETSQDSAETERSRKTDDQYLRIFSALRKAPGGLTRYALETQTGIRDKTIDARLWKLGAERLVFKRTDHRGEGRTGKPVEIVTHLAYRDRYPTAPFISKPNQYREEIRRLNGEIAENKAQIKALREALITAERRIDARGRVLEEATIYLNKRQHLIDPSEPIPLRPLRIAVEACHNASVRRMETGEDFPPTQTERDKDAPAAIAKAALRDIRDNYDHDEDAHRHGHADTQCRCCIAAQALQKIEEAS